MAFPSASRIDLAAILRYVSVDLLTGSGVSLLFFDVWLSDKSRELFDTGRLEIEGCWGSGLFTPSELLKKFPTDDIRFRPSSKIIQEKQQQSGTRILSWRNN